MDMNVDAMIGSVSERVAPISRQIWDAKYLPKTADGTPVI
jgi:ribonucleoside-diphosphate reductase alpha chain